MQHMLCRTVQNTYLKFVFIGDSRGILKFFNTVNLYLFEICFYQVLCYLVYPFYVNSVKKCKRPMRCNTCYVRWCRMPLSEKKEGRYFSVPTGSKGLRTGSGGLSITCKRTEEQKKTGIQIQLPLFKSPISRKVC